MPNLSALSNAVTAATGLSNLILVTPAQTVGYQPQNAPNPDGTPSTSQQPPSFLFDYEGEQTTTLDSDITDHYVEDNTAIQDQIALKPVLVTTHGFIGELNDVAPAFLAPVKAIADKLTVVSAYSPQASETAILAYDNAFQLYQVGQNAVNAAVSAWTSLTSGQGTSVITGNAFFPIALEANQTKQQTAFQLFYGYWTSRTLFTIQTPWAIFQNMAIKTLRSIQDAETRMITDFEISFKQIRTASTALTPPQSAVSQGRLSAQSSLLTNQGVSTPPASISLVQGLTSNFAGAFS